MARRLIIVTGMSGAGKTTVLNVLEDLSYYCIDSLPIDLAPELFSQIRSAEQPLYENVAIGIDARNPADALTNFPRFLRQQQSSELAVELVFVEAGDEALLRRFSETRRKHPLSATEVPLTVAIHEERRLLGPLAEYADLRIDTSRTSVHQLRALVRERVAQRQANIMSVQLISFGFKHGLPADADFVFDVRCLPNPHWEPRLRDLSGRDPPVIEFLEAAPLVHDMTAQLRAFLDSWLPRFEADQRSYLTVAVGCTGGHHRSVYIVERLASHLSSQGRHVLVTHRDGTGIL